MSISTSGWYRLALLAIVSCCLGCQETVVPSFPPPDTKPKITADPIQAAAPADPQPAAKELPPPDREVWSVVFIEDKKIGYSHFAERRVEEGGKKLLHSRGFSEFTVDRGKDRSTQQMEMQSWESSDGELQRFESRITSARGDIVASGKRQDAQMIVTINTLGKRVTSAVPWPDKCGGYFATEQSLAKSPLKVGEQRAVWGLDAAVNLPTPTVLTALQEEEVDIRGLKQKLLKVQQDVKLVGESVPLYCWINERGEILKVLNPGPKQTFYRTTKEFALDKSDYGTVDIMELTTVKLKGELPKTRPLKKAVYLAKLNDHTYPDQFSSDEFQKVEKVDDQTARLTITQIDRGRKIDSALVVDKPTNADSAPNSLIQSDDPAIIALANSLAPENAEPLLVALALETGVRRHINKRNYGQAFATAAEVVRSQEGDCTEHAVLLAAVCRARKIPARVVLGLVFYPPQNGFAYHMWNEVWLDGRWLPLDATVAQGTVGADHIKLRHASLQGQSALAVMAPLVQVVGRLELEVVTAD